jgi:ABC-type phosphate transport system permease subunit
VTGGSLALARALGEVAPLLYTTALGSHSAAVEGGFGLSLLPTEVFALAPSAGLGGHGAASTLALVLLVTVVLVAGLGRLAGRRLS